MTSHEDHAPTSATPAIPAHDASRKWGIVSVNGALVLAPQDGEVLRVDLRHIIHEVVGVPHGHCVVVG